MNDKPPREIIKRITVLMPSRPSSADDGGSKDRVITDFNEAGEEPLTKRRLCILKFKEIEYIITQRIRALTTQVAQHPPVVNRLTVDHLVTGSSLKEGNQERVKNSDIIIAYIGNSDVFGDSVNIIYEMALRNVLRPELILLGELESEEVLNERVGFYLSQYTLVNAEWSRDDEVFQTELKLAKDTQHYALDDYDCPIPELLRMTIDKGAAQQLEDKLKTNITNVIKDPPNPEFLTKFIEQLDPQKLVSTSTCYLPSSVVRVTFEAQVQGKNHYTPDQLIELTVCDYNEDFENIYGFRKQSNDKNFRVDDEFLFAQLEKFINPVDLEEFGKDQEILFESIVYRPGVGMASVPLRINERHPLPAYRNKEYLPITILRKSIGDPRLVHSYLLLVVYAQVGLWRQKIIELVPKPKRLRAVPTIFDESVLRCSLDPDQIPANWAGRVLYLGEEGARAWLGVIGDPSYTLAIASDSAFKLRQMRREALEQVRPEIETLVSLGPGDGELDQDIVDTLTNRLPKVRYIPVEISSGLLAMSVQKLKRNVDIPVAILGDFETGLRQVEQALDEYDCRPKPVLFSLIGGTLGNLDRAGSGFLDGFSRHMQPGDGLLLDVPLAGPAWSAAADPRMAKDHFNDPFRRFLAGGVARLNKDVSTAAYKSWFDERIECDYAPSNVMEGTQVITIRDRPTGRTLLRFNRYNWDSLLSWLVGRGFVIRYARNSLSSPRDVFGMGVVLLEQMEQGS